MRRIGRRVFVQRSALAFLAMGLPPEILVRPLGAARRRAGKKILVCLFQRGAVDGLNMIVPFGEDAYYRDRRGIAIPPPRRGGDAQEFALDLDGFFGLHPSLAPLGPLYAEGELAVVHAAGSPHPTRSHFDAQDYMETATPGRKLTQSGWLNRVLQVSGESCLGCRGRSLEDGADHALDHAIGQAGVAGIEIVPSLRGVAIANAMPRSLAGAHPTLAIPNIERFGRAVSPGLERLYRTAGGDAVSGVAEEAFDAVRVLESIDPDRYRPAENIQYPRNPFGESLRQIAQLVKADVGVEIAFAEIGGWDTHVGQGGIRGQLSQNLAQLAQGIRALHDDLGILMEDVIILTMSEFGRTVAENGSGGTDHGHANCMLVLGGGVRGGRVYGDWPGLEPEQRFEGRDLAVTTDFRDVFGEVIDRHLGIDPADGVFPDYSVDRARYRDFLL